MNVGSPRVGLGLVALLVGGACQSGSAPPVVSSVVAVPSASAASASPQGSDPFVYATVRERPMAPPARYRAKLPSLIAPAGASSKDDGWPSDAPPRAHLVDLVCTGDPDARAAFLESLEAAGGTARSAEDLKPYGALLRGCEDASRCEWAAAVVKSDRALLVRQTVWTALVGCDPRFDPLFDLPDVPTAVLVDHVQGRRFSEDDAPPRAWPRLVDAAKALERDPKRLHPVLYALAATRRAVTSSCRATESSRRGRCGRRTAARLASGARTRRPRRRAPTGAETHRRIFNARSRPSRARRGRPTSPRPPAIRRTRAFGSRLSRLRTPRRRASRPPRSSRASRETQRAPVSRMTQVGASWSSGSVTWRCSISPRPTRPPCR
jgi:hypothetical protein